MKNKLIALLALLVLMGLPVAAQQSVSQSFTMSVVGPPPAVNSGQTFSSAAATGVSVSSTGGSIAAGTYRIAVTYFSTSNTETTGSVDTAATAVVTTTGSTSSLTVQPPVFPNAPANVVGYRIYIGASGGGTGAETLQTINAALCTLSSSATASCALSSPAVFTSSAGFTGGGGAPATPGTLLTIPTSNAANISLFENSLYPTRIITWVTSGTAPSACTFQVQTGAAPGSLANVGQAITCTTTGTFAIPIATRAAYSGVNVTTFTPADLTTSVNFTMIDLPYLLGNYWGNAVPTSACTAGTGFFTASGTTTSTIYTCVTGTWTAVTLP